MPYQPERYSHARARGATGRGRNDPRWDAVRRRVIDRNRAENGGTVRCGNDRCDASGLRGQDRHVDHWYCWCPRCWPGLVYVEAYLRVLCQRCNRQHRALTRSDLRADDRALCDRFDREYGRARATREATQESAHTQDDDDDVRVHEGDDAQESDDTIDPDDVWFG